MNMKFIFIGGTQSFEFLEVVLKTLNLTNISDWGV